MPKETMKVRIDPDLKERIEKLASDLNETKSDLVRKALMDYIRRKGEKRETKKIAAKKFASGKISFEELTRITGYGNAREIASHAKAAEKSFEEGLYGSGNISNDNQDN